MENVGRAVENHNVSWILVQWYLTRYYNSLPPVAKTYAVICFMTAATYQLELYNIWNIALFYSDVFRRFQVWRLVTNFFFIGAFSFTFAFRLLIILRYGVQLERGPFDKRTADYVWMFLSGAIALLVMSIFPFLWSPFMGASLVFMIVYIWGREFPNERTNVYGLVQFKGFYLPWYMLGIDMILGNPLKPDMHAGNRCRPYILLPHGPSSSRKREKLLQDSSLGVSFS
nr:derlin-1.2-like isoform X2 [Ipomoea batatas]